MSRDKRSHDKKSPDMMGKDMTAVTTAAENTSLEHCCHQQSSCNNTSHDQVSCETKSYVTMSQDTRTKRQSGISGSKGQKRKSIVKRQVSLNYYFIVKFIIITLWMINIVSLFSIIFQFLFDFTLMTH